MKGYRRGWKRGMCIVCLSSLSSVVSSTGISWFVQAEDLRFESRKENCSNSIPGPGSSWFEPFTTTKPWREPLREKNFQEQQCSKVTQLAAPERDAETRPIQPLVKLTLQVKACWGPCDFSTNVESCGSTFYSSSSFFFLTALYLLEPKQKEVISLVCLWQPGFAQYNDLFELSSVEGM